MNKKPDLRVRPSRSTLIDKVVKPIPIRLAIVMAILKDNRIKAKLIANPQVQLRDYLVGIGGRN